MDKVTLNEGWKALTSNVNKMVDLVLTPLKRTKPGTLKTNVGTGICPAIEGLL